MLLNGPDAAGPVDDEDDYGYDDEMLMMIM